MEDKNKIYEINDCDIAFLPKGKTIKDLIDWYKEYCGEELNPDEIKEVNYSSGFWDCNIPEKIKKKLMYKDVSNGDQFFLDKNKKIKEGTVEIKYGDPYIFRLFSTEVKENTKEEIYILCSKEW